MNNTVQDLLEQAFTESKDLSTFDLTKDELSWIQTIVENAESQKAVLAALMTSLVKKIDTPTQDVRLHKIEMQDGYSGRSYNTNYITPFLATHFRRYAMKSGSGWLTRSIEQNHAFTLHFPGKIQNASVKKSFLLILDAIEAQGRPPYPFLLALLSLLNRQAIVSQVNFTTFKNRDSIGMHIILRIVGEHFFSSYSGSGASRLPVLAVYAMYKLLLPQFAAFSDKRLLPLKSHTTADLKSRSLGDIEVVDSQNNFFEVVEIKHGIPITAKMVRDAFDKYQKTNLQRYYILTTADPNFRDEDSLFQVIEEVRQQHPCVVIPNGVLPTLKYYLRFVPRPVEFLSTYTELLEQDYTENTDLKEIHLRRWQEIRTMYELT